MPEWLEHELAHHLAPVEAPATLTWQPRPKTPRRSFTLAPILALSALLALLILATAPSRMSVGDANRYLRRAGIALTIPPATDARVEGIRIVESGGARIAAVTYRLNGAANTILIARAGSAAGPAWKSHGVYSVAGGCVLCHADLAD